MTRPRTAKQIAVQFKKGNPIGAKTRLKPGADARREGTQFQPGNIAYLKHGLLSKYERLPEEYRIKYPVSMTLTEMSDTLTAMIGMANDLLEYLSLSPDVEAIEFVGNYQQLIARLGDIRAEINGGKQRAANFGALSPEDEATTQQEWARALGNGLTKFKQAYEYADTFGIVDAKGKLRRNLVHGLAGTLGGSGKIIEKWAKLRRWQERKQGSTRDRMIEAYAKTIQRR